MFKCNCGKEFKTQRGLSTHGFKCDKFDIILKAIKKKSKYFIVDKNIYICECGKEFEKAQSLNGHFSFCLIHRNGKEPIKRCITTNGWIWRKGRTLEEALGKEKAKEYRNKLSIGATKRRIGISLTEKHKESISRGRIKFLENNGDHHTLWYEVFNGKFNIKVQGTWEKKVAEWLTSNNIYWERKRLKYLNNRFYTSDFYLPDFNIYIEVKGWMKDRDIYKMNKVLEYNNIDLRLIEKNEFKNLDNLKLENLPIFKEYYKDYKIDYSLFTIRY